MKSILICVYGLPGTGKSTIIKQAQNLDEDIDSVSMGEIVREKAVAAIDTPDPTGNQIGQWATNQREKHGKDIIAEYTLEKAKKVDTPFIVIEGMRTVNELQVFNSEHSTKTIRIDSTFADRLSRLQTRGRNKDTNTPQEVINRDARELKWGLGELIAIDNPDVVLQNDSTLSDHQRKSKLALKELIEKHK